MVGRNFHDSPTLIEGTVLLVSNDKATMSLAGAQEKVGLRFDAKRGTLTESVGLHDLRL